MNSITPISPTGRTDILSRLRNLAAAPRAPFTLGWALFGILLLWGWRVPLWDAVPAYGDVLEVLWGIEWYNNTLLNGQDFTFTPQIFYPAGWHVTTFAHGPGLFVLLLPLYKLGGGPFAFNVAFLLLLAVGYWGMYRLSDLVLPPAAAVLAALLFTYWGTRWMRVGGHLNVLLISSLLPWMVWTLERGLQSRRRSWWLWPAFVAGLWTLGIGVSLYLIWFGLLAVGGWALIRAATGEMRRRVVMVAAVAVLTTAVLVAPLLMLFLHGYTAAEAAFYNPHHLDGWGASVNNIPIPHVYHPWLRTIVRQIYKGRLDESAVANFGSLAFLLCLVGARAVWSDRRWWPLLWLTGAGIVLALGLTLKWDGHAGQVRPLAPLDMLLWRIAHWLKPAFFVSPDPAPPFTAAVPLPGWLLVAIIPFWEGARTVSRFALVAGVGFFPLVALGAWCLRPVWLRLPVAALLVVEILPLPIRGVPAPTVSHPAFDWLREQTPRGTVIVEFYAPVVDRLDLPVRGSTLWATRYHDRPTVAGAGGVWPAPTATLIDWLLHHPHPFRNSAFAPLLRTYDVRYVVLHMHGPNESTHWDEARNSPVLEEVACFPPPEGASPWPYPICVAGIAPAPQQ